MTMEEENYTSESAKHLTKSHSVRETETAGLKVSWLMTWFLHIAGGTCLALSCSTLFTHNLTECVTIVSKLVEEEALKPDKYQWPWMTEGWAKAKKVLLWGNHWQEGIFRPKGETKKKKTKVEVVTAWVLAWNCRVQTLTLSLISCVTMGKLPNYFKMQVMN